MASSKHLFFEHLQLHQMLLNQTNSSLDQSVACKATSAGKLKDTLLVYFGNMIITTDNIKNTTLIIRLNRQGCSSLKHQELLCHHQIFQTKSININQEVFQLIKLVSHIIGLKKVSAHCIPAWHFVSVICIARMKLHFWRGMTDTKMID